MPYTVFVADDETIIRQGLHYIIDWNLLGFQIIGEAADGQSALLSILELNPDVVMLDIKMPKVSGLDVAKKLREQHYNGKIIILSGYSDFKYAQEAIRYDITYYLTKPIDAKELASNMQALAASMKEERQSKISLEQYQDQLKRTILTDLVCGVSIPSSNDFDWLNLTADLYQIVICEKFSHSLGDSSYDFSNMLRITNQDNNLFDTITIDNYEVIILKGIFTINQFNRFVERLNSNQMPQKGSPLDSLFITYGRCVNTLEQLSFSYSEAMHLMERRFFCKENQHTVNYIQLPDPQSMSIAATTENLEAYCSSLITAIQTFNTVSIEQLLESLTKELYCSLDSINNSKLFLADLFISMKEKITFRYYPVKITLPNNTQIIEYIQTRYYLFQIIQYFRDNINLIINTISTSSVDNAMNDIINYIDHNYMENLKLEGIATLFGYNSSYLGKTISAKIGVNFNTYLDQVRIRNAKELLETSDLKVYNIAARVGYKNVDAFHEKFKKATGLTPSEYKKTCNVQENEES